MGYETFSVGWTEMLDEPRRQQKKTKMGRNTGEGERAAGRMTLELLMRESTGTLPNFTEF